MHVVRLVLLVGVPLLRRRLRGRLLVPGRRGAAPVAALRRGVGDITEAGTGARLPVPPTRDEVARLAETLNDMLDRLAAGGARQRAFVADAAHELRSPLASIRTQLEVAQAHPEAAAWRRRPTTCSPTSTGSAGWSTTCCCWPGWTTTARRCAASGPVDLGAVAAAAVARPGRRRRR